MKLKRTNDPELIALLNEPVQNLHHRLYPDQFKPFDFKAMYDYFNNMINQANHYFVIYEINDIPVGYIWYEEIIRPESAFRNLDHFIYIHQVSVNEEHRGKGVGKQLFNSVLELAVEKSIKRIGLDYWAMNENAKQIYRNIGFELEKEVAYLNV